MILKSDYQILFNLSDDEINQVVDIHMLTFKGFFLTFLGKGFLKTLYEGFSEHADSNILLLKKENTVVGFIAYSHKVGEFYKWLLRNKLLHFIWFSSIASIRNPKSSIRLIRALAYPSKNKNDDKYIEILSIGIHPDYKNKGFGSLLLKKIIEEEYSEDIQYIRLTTDAVDNDLANAFYKKNDFKLYSTYVTPEGREMNEYRYYGEIK
ncbi:GNAT family N-acetyltransferase [Streptococcus suis]|nr:GNAT family N-acetyltransferase [Streptococcus suis]